MRVVRLCMRLCMRVCVYVWVCVCRGGLVELDMKQWLFLSKVKVMSSTYGGFIFVK